MAGKFSHGFFICHRFGSNLGLWSIQKPCQKCFPGFCSPPSEVAVLFNLNLSRFSFLGQVIDLDLLFCTVFNSHWIHNMQICSYALFLLINQWIIGRLSEKMGVVLVSVVCNNSPLKFYFPWIKSVWVVTFQNLQCITLELSQYSKTGSTFLKQDICCLQQLQQTRKYPLFVLAVWPASCAGAQEFRLRLS